MKNKKSFIIFLPLIFLLLILGLLLVLKGRQVPIFTGLAENQGQILFSGEKTKIKSEETLPLTIQVKTPKTPKDRGITGIKVVITFPSSLLTLSAADIKTSLPPPWSFFHREVGQEEVILEAIFLAPQEKGYLGAQETPQTLAILNFKSRGKGKGTIRLVKEKSALLTKEKNLNILGGERQSFSFEIKE